MWLRICYLFLAIFIYLFALPAHADYWSKLKHKVENSVKNPDDDDSDDADNYDDGGNGGWVGFNGSIPPAAVVGGHQHHPIIICRGYYQDNLIPGRLTDDGSCSVAYFGIEYRVPVDSILVGNGYYWVDSNNSLGVPPEAVLGGHESGYSVLRICQAHFEDAVYPGKLAGTGYCYISAHGREVPRADFRVLCRHDD